MILSTNRYVPVFLALLCIRYEVTTFSNNSDVGKMINGMYKMWHCMTSDEHITPNEQNVLFRLYTRNNKDQSELLSLNNGEEVEALRLKVMRKKRGIPQQLSKDAIIQSEYFIVNADIKILIHGYSETISNTKMIDIKNVYLEKGEYNIIVVDWGALANSTCYIDAARAVSKVGDMIGRLLDQLILSGVPLTSIHIIGFSLGAHVAGFAGKNVKLGVIERITGLDPALPMFIAKDSAKRLHQTDAVYVDIIHTCAGTLGIKSHIGHADFYPNGGSDQSGCCNVLCSHSRAPIYYFESIRRPTGFRAVRCGSWKHFSHGDCDSNPYALMGDASNIRNRGTFYLRTSNATPYCLDIHNLET
ncbi:lipase member H-A-like [Diprion similis]|uniref:lipase member H-A-like n=1 Tax=Diprion similis TaxID=362088 RepID=UPI001EF8CB76|nr:lipase member H-A-like [Diprion similis]